MLARSRRLVLFVDTWETLEFSLDVDEWLSTKLLRNLPSGTTAVLFGRNKAQKFPPCSTPRPTDSRAPSEADTKAYLGTMASRIKLADAVFELTKGYPYRLALACDLSREARSCGCCSTISAASDAIAEELLKRLLEEKGVEKVRDFLEKGIVADWFDRDSIRSILGVSEKRASNIFQKISTFSFVRWHPCGLQFHEDIRDTPYQDDLSRKTRRNMKN